MSRFDDLLKKAKERPRASQEPPPAPEPPSPAPRPVGRPKGKRSDPDYVQVSSHIPRELHFKVKAALLLDRKGVEFSELVADLLSEWLSKRPGGGP